jgi:phosphatidylglycerophosphate synthase
MVLGSPVKRRPVKGPLEKAGLAVAAALLLLVCAASLRCSAAFGSALAAPPRKLWGGGVSIAAEASGAAAEECDLFDGKWARRRSTASSLGASRTQRPCFKLWSCN